MRILYVAQTFYPTIGGAERYIDTLAKWMVKRGHEVHVLAPAPWKAPYSVWPVSFMENWKRPLLYHMRAYPVALKIVPLLRKLSPDIIHLQYPNPLVLAYPLLRIRSPVVTTTHGSELHFLHSDLLGPLYFMLMRRLDAIISVSDYTAGLLKKGGVAGNVHVIYNGVDTDRFRPAIGDPSEIVCVTRLVRRKDVPTLLKALKMVLKEADVCLTICGDGPERENFESLSHSLGLEDHVRFLGFVSEDYLMEILSSSGLFVLPGIYDPMRMDVEGFGIAILEAMASETPVIGADVGGVRSVIRSEWGLLYRPGDPEDLARKMLYILNDRQKAVEMARNGLKAVKEIYSVDAMGRKTEEIYEYIT